ncbi:TonB-dependent receptor [Chitinophaga sedimenti]|uniref:TonB-dependent receptor n=1 Tax=Chitinophaga sedimenti TaxID=2033606 RepID=UPI0020050252|nr:TonB-dependent receptor [Chitinophaga sedimenti]MCK7554213.1 TonB-dependent receptor [Chitinophaga sedimenti]
MQQNERRRLKWNAAFDFATNIDNQRTDPDNGYAATDKYISTYNSYGVQGGVQSTRLKPGLVKSWDVTGSLSYQPAKIDLVQWVQTRSAYILFNAMEAGEHDARYVTPSYAGKMLVDGKPLYAFLKAKTTLGFRTGQLRHKLMLGVESNYSKNFGRGQVYDVDFPVSSTTPVNQRPRTFDSIPGMWNQSFFAQDEISVYVGPHKLTAVGGLRGMMLAGMDSRYAIANKMYVDPRLNLRWKLPLANMGSKQLEVTIGAGYGLHTKMPTLDQLYPAPVFRDIVQLNFFHNNPEFRRANVVTYIMDESNPNLKPARNNKFEVNADFEVDGNRLSVTVFNEDMHTGFTTNSRYMSLSYKKYDPQSVDAANLTSPPQTSDFSYVEKHQLYNYNIAVNGSRLRKQGVEYQFSTKRFKGVNTRFTVNGAWFRSTYNSSLPTHALIGSDYLVNGEVAQLVGIYSDPTGETRQYMNTNLVIDSYLPKLGVTISSSIQTVVFRTQQNTQKSGVPSAYVDAHGVTHPYTKESELDADLKLLKMFYSATEAVVDRVPMSLQANLKMTKEFRKTAAMSLFVNRLFTYGVNYYNKNNVYIKQNTYTTPYFGAEVTFNF